MRPVLLIFFILALGCATSPTGRSQLSLISSSQMNQMGAQSFEQMKKKIPIDQSPRNNRLVKCVSLRLLKAIGEKPGSWEVIVFKDQSPNAFALPGNKIGVHTGMLSLIENPHQLAAVIGHEIGHVHSNHGNERVSQNMLVKGGLTLSSVFLGLEKNNTKGQLLFAALGLGAQVGILLPFSREHEREADRLGLDYMSKAGFDPFQASRLWEIMKQKAGGRAPAEFFSTHPSNDSRIKNLKAYAQKLPPYQGGEPCQI